MSQNARSHRTYLPDADNRRHPYPPDTMVLIHCMPQWYNLSDEELADVKAEWAIAMCPGKLIGLQKNPIKNKVVIAFDKLKSSILAKVEHPFRLIKRQFGFVKRRYKGLRKHDSQQAMLFTRELVANGLDDSGMG